MDFWPSRLSNIFFEITISCSIFVVELTAAAVVTVISSSLLESSILFNVQRKDKKYNLRFSKCRLPSGFAQKRGVDRVSPNPNTRIVVDGK